MSSRHQFHLRWSNYGHNLANSFLRLFESESLADVTLFCEGESYRAHRVVLAASSQHFQELFEQCSSAQNLVVILDGTSSANLRALLEFMYKGEVYIDDANLNSFLQTAKRLQVKGLSLSQNDLQSISSDAGEERGGAGGGTPGTNENILAQALGPLLQSGPVGAQTPQGQPPKSNANSVQSPPTSFSSPSPSQTPPNSTNAPSGLYVEDKHRKKFRISSSPKHPSPDGNIPEEYGGGGGHHPHPPRPSAPIPSPNINSRLMDIDQRPPMVPGFPAFGPIYPTSGQLGPPPSPQSHQQQQQHSQQSQQQTIVITENPNIRKIRSASTENTMPEDLSIKLEVGREEEMITGKQRSFSMDLSPSEPPFGMGGGPGPSNVWSLPSPQSVSAQHHDLNLDNAQSTPDGKLMNGKKLKCPFCERLYGYETNLRAHIRQRHQGIRVPCPFCTRTFTRNNTVRRHVAREHRALLGGVRPFHPHPLHGGGGENAPPFPPTSSPGGHNSINNQQQGQNPATSSANQNNMNNAMSGGQLIQQQQQQHMMNSQGGHGGGGMNSMNMMGVAAAVAAAAAGSGLPPSSPPLSSGSGSGNSNRPSSRTSSVGGGSGGGGNCGAKPVD